MILEYHNPNDDRDRDSRYLIGSCNGLLWFLYHSNFNSGNFTLGYENSKDTFKVVRFFPKTTKVRVFSLKDNVWKNIQNSPGAHRHQFCPMKLKYVNFSDSVNWLVICNHFGHEYNYKDISIEQFVIISLDLRSETHT
jgi:hypothetical protein